MFSIGEGVSESGYYACETAINLKLLERKKLRRFLRGSLERQKSRNPGTANPS